VQGSILALLEHHGALRYEQIAAQLGEAPDAVRNALARLRDERLVDVISTGALVGNLTNAVAHWRLAPAGRAELARLRTLT
jgi:predicted ArsR family transcriptional regulator